jgi:sarcosine oxidase subunit gamma
MADMSTLRKPALTGVSGGSANVRLTIAPPAARASMRAAPDAVLGLASALGLYIPEAPKTSSSANGMAALWLGPDEWLLIGPDGSDFIGMTANSGVIHSMTDVSHRNVGIIVSGPGAADTISSACPQNLSLSVFPVGACSRTVFGKIEVVLYRVEEELFRVECWRSFADYCFGMLSEGAHDAAL